MTQPTHEQRLRDELDTFLENYGAGRFQAHPQSMTKHLMGIFRRYEEESRREFVEQVRAEIESDDGYTRSKTEILSMPLLQLEETNEK
jgi:hypothetical protein